MTNDKFSFGIGSVLQYLALLCVMSLAFSAEAATYYVSPTGSDTGSCAAAQSATTPRRGIQSTWGQCLIAGDTLYLKGGTYTEFVNTGNFSGLPSGKSWSNAITIASAPSETAVWKPTSQGALNVAYTSYIIFDRITWDGSGLGTDPIVIFAIDCGYSGGWIPGSCSHHIRIQDSTFQDYAQNSVMTAAHNSDNEGCCNEFIRNVFQRGGAGAPSFDEAESFYVGTSGNLWEYNVFDQLVGAAISIRNGYGRVTNDNIVRYNFFKNGGLVGSSDPFITEGVFIQNGTGNKIYNNLFYNIVGTAIRLNFPQNTVIYNNTIYDAGKDPAGGASQPPGCIYLTSSSSGPTIKNNLLINCTGGAIVNDGGSFTQSNNISTGTASDHFVNVAGGDFRLKLTSSAIDAGANLSPIIVDDFAGVVRPQGGAYDLGAYEFVSTVSQTPPTTPINLTVVP